MFDFCLHDGSHAAETVAADLRLIVPRMRQYGIIAVHDAHHSYSGDEMRRGIREGLYHVLHTQMTLPYGFGLTLIRIEGNSQNGPVALSWRKKGSSHRTVPVTLWTG